MESENYERLEAKASYSRCETKQKEVEKRKKKKMVVVRKEGEASDDDVHFVLLRSWRARKGRVVHRSTAVRHGSRSCCGLNDRSPPGLVFRIGKLPGTRVE